MSQLEQKGWCKTSEQIQDSLYSFPECSFPNNPNISKISSLNQSNLDADSPLFKKCKIRKYSKPIGEVVREIILKSDRFYRPEPFRRKKFTSHGTKIIYSVPDNDDEDSCNFSKNESFLWSKVHEKSEPVKDISKSETFESQIISSSPKPINFCEPQFIDETKSKICGSNLPEIVFHDNDYKNVTSSIEILSNDSDIVSESSGIVSKDHSVSNLLLVADQRKMLTNSMFLTCPNECQIKFGIPKDLRVVCSNFIHWEKCSYQTYRKTIPNSVKIHSHNTTFTKSDSDLLNNDSSLTKTAAVKLPSNKHKTNKVSVKKSSDTSKRSLLKRNNSSYNSSTMTIDIPNFAPIRYFSAEVLVNVDSLSTPYSSCNDSANELHASLFDSVSMDTLAVDDSNYLTSQVCWILFCALFLQRFVFYAIDIMLWCYV